jgi:hypothetical protein
MPTTVLVSSDGEVVYVKPGEIDAAKLRALIDEHLT